MIKNLKNSKGITLIALVITIIVLLILAGVAISMLSGENGILKQASNAKLKTDLGKLSESIKLAATTAITDVEHKLTEDKLKTELEKDGYKVDEDGTVTQNNIKYALTDKGAVKATIKDLKEGNAEMLANLTLIDDNEEQIVIPAGFKIKEDSPTTVKRGIVIVAPDNSEFVWVPVKDASKMYGTNSAGTKLGKLYDFTATGHTANGWSETNGVMSWISIIQYREPDYLKSTSSGDASVDENEGLNLLSSIVKIPGKVGTDNATMLSKWEAQLKNEFKQMIESVESKKGFYVGRYETSLNKTTNYAQSISGATSATTENSSTNTWYGFYQKQKEYSANNSLTEKVGSSMIWGSQYDQMMIWMQNNKIDVTTTTPKNLEGVTTTRNTTRVTGSKSEDKLSNIYDLLGNSSEWTLEARNYDGRAIRGGFWANEEKAPIYRGYTNLYKPGSGTSSRMTLYIK